MASSSTSKDGMASSSTSKDGMASSSTSEDGMATPTVSPTVGKNKREKEKIREDILNSIFKVTKLRREVPERLKKIETTIINRNVDEATNAVFLPSTVVEEMTSEHLFNKPIHDDSEVADEMRNLTEELLTRVEKLSKRQPEIEKCMLERTIKKK